MESGKNLKFPNRIAGDDNGNFDGERFKAPLSGRYQIRLNLMIWDGSGAYNYAVQMMRSGSAIHYLDASGQKPFFIGGTKLLTKFYPVNNFSNNELDIILKCRNLEIC